MKSQVVDIDALNWTCVCKGKRYEYSICEDGTVLRTQHSSLKESKPKITIKNGKAWIYIGRTMYKLDSLVARYFISDYGLNDIIEHTDGDLKNCAVWNLRIIPRAEYNKGRSRNGLAKPVIADGIFYPSVVACAKALYVEQSHLHKYLRGEYKDSFLDSHDIRFVETEGDSHEDRPL